jgi:hypothetical protein
VKHARRFHDDCLVPANDLHDRFALLIKLQLHQPSGSTLTRPGSSRIADGLAVSMKQILRNAGTARRLVLAGSPSPFNDFFQLTFKHNLVRTPILDVFGSRDNNAGASIHIGPCQRGNLTFAPRSDIGKSGEILQVIGQRGNHGVKLDTFKEPLTDIVFRKPANVRRLATDRP